jgi:hypothetical protein
LRVAGSIALERGPRGVEREAVDLDDESVLTPEKSTS